MLSPPPPLVPLRLVPPHPSPLVSPPLVLLPSSLPSCSPPCLPPDVALAVSHKEIKSSLQEEMYDYGCGLVFIVTNLFSLMFHSAQVLSNPSVKLDSIDDTKESKQIKLQLSNDSQFRFDDQSTPITVVPCSAKGKGVDEESSVPEIAKVEEWLSVVT